MAPYMFLNTQLLELDKFGASGLQVESASRFVSNALLAGTHDEGHEGGRLDLKEKETTIRIPDRCVYGHTMSMTTGLKPILLVDRSRHHTGHTCTSRRPSLVSPRWHGSLFREPLPDSRCCPLARHAPLWVCWWWEA